MQPSVLLFAALSCLWRELSLSPFPGSALEFEGISASLTFFFFLSPQSKHVMQEKQETLLDTINKLKSDVDKGKEKSTQQKAHIRDLQQV